MSEKYLSLKRADRRIFNASFDDGLVDIFISSVVLMFVVAPFLSRYLGDFWSSAIFLPIWGLLFIVLRWVRIHVINPRKGVVKYGQYRKRKLTLFSWIMLGLNIAFFLSGLAVGLVLPSSPGWMTLFPFSVMVLAMFSLAGYFLDVSRFYVYGLMLAIGPFVGEWLFQFYNAPHHGYPIIFGIYAIAIFLIGLIKLIKFLRDNPLPGEDHLQWETSNG
jgi:MFS family permease